MAKEGYQRKGWEDRIKNIQSDIAFREQVGYRQSGISDQYLKEVKEELRFLTTPPEVRVKELQARIGIGFGFSMSVLEGLEAQLASAKAEIAGKSSETAAQTSSSTVRPVVPQGDTRGLHPTGLHTPTAAEIVANANKPDPTAPYLDTNSDFGRMINPLEPHWARNGDFVKFVDPLKPGLKKSGPA